MGGIGSGSTKGLSLNGSSSIGVGAMDLEAVAALAWALEDFKGTVIMASHDRGLLDEVATKIIAFEDDGIHNFKGPLEEYLAT